MLKRVLILTTLFAMVIPGMSQVLPNFGGQRAGLSTLSFLKNDLNPRSTGMAGASIANEADAFASIVNPAAAATLEESAFGLSHLMVGAGVQQSFGTYQHKLKNEATLGLSINSLNSGDMMVRTEFQPNGTGQYFSFTQNAIKGSYATRLSEQFSLGVGLNYIYEALPGYNASTASVDLGFLYKTDVKNLRFAVVVQNFGGNSRMNGSTLAVDYNRGTPELQQYSLPTVFKMGFAFDAYSDEKNTLQASMQLNNPNDNAENIRIGFELRRNDLIAVQAGYKLSVKGQSYPCFGFQYKSRINVHPLYIGYGMNPTQFMGIQHNLGIQLSINKMERS